MPSIIHQFTATIPHNTQKASLATVKLALPSEVVVLVDLEVPHGPRGLMGFYLALSGQQIVPFEVGQFIVWDNVVRSWQLSDFPTTGAWSVVGYNLDLVNDHAVTVRFHDEPLTPDNQSVVFNPTIVTTISDAEGVPIT